MKSIIIITLFVGLFTFYFIAGDLVFNKTNINFNIFINDLNFILDILVYILVFILFPVLVGGKRAFRIYFIINNGYHFAGTFNKVTTGNIPNKAYS